jgi:hypothetical protein
LPSTLVAAAQTFDLELRALEDLATQLEKNPISSEKTLQRSGALLEEAGRLHAQLGESLGGLVAAIETTRARQQAALDRVLEETRRVEARSHEYRELMARFAALGTRAREINGPVSAVVSQKEAGLTAEALVEALRVVEELTLAVVTDADAVVTDARAGNWPDVARDAQALRQSMQAALNTLTLATRDAAGRAPS